MPDQILINDLFLRTIIGVNDDERTNRQDVLINLCLDVDTRAAGKSDDIADAVNYKTIAKRVIFSSSTWRTRSPRSACATRASRARRCASRSRRPCDSRDPSGSPSSGLVMTSDGKPVRVFLCLGSNIEPETNLPAAVRELQRFGTVANVSQVWQTAPVGYAEQADFLNAAVLLETSLSAEELRRDVIPEIEAKLHRVRDPHNKNAPRTIDIDIALYGREVLDVAGRRIPDPDILSRPFVAVPLAELDADYVHPETGTTLREIADGLEAAAGGMKHRRGSRRAAKMRDSRTQRLGGSLALPSFETTGSRVKHSTRLRERLLDRLFHLAAGVVVPDNRAGAIDDPMAGNVVRLERDQRLNCAVAVQPRDASRLEVLAH
jgi:2-amino-4-hydroxy-6-hydroxymethyldihydropteridine diphosphokinase